MIAIHVRAMKILAVVSAWLSLLGCASAPQASGGSQSMVAARSVLSG